MTERTQVTEAIADYKMGVKGLDDTVERLGAILGVEDTDTLRDILTEGENDPSNQIVDEIDAEYYLDYEYGQEDYDDEDDEEPDPAEGIEFGGEAGGA